ncbi:MAG TPA: cobyrinate a,c-diamide synthase [Desulfobulbaceae bacterium]|nr:cobyrinate a,c-diamide synthase [Desulfobulbaceae bacterium]
MAGKYPSVVIAGTSSGCGKTTVTLGVMAALCKREVKVQPFKCGPDFIDPSLHRQVTGRVSRNLDVRMCGAEYVHNVFADHAPEDGISIVEGVMGLFDGGLGSAAHLAGLLDIPVLLVVDVRSAAESVAAVVKGFETFADGIRVVGVILNRVGSERHRQMIADAVQLHCRAEIIGALPRDRRITLPSRHLGLHMGTEVQLNRKRLIEFMEKHLNLDRLQVLAAQARYSAPVNSKPEIGKAHPIHTVRLGLARDESFCFYYRDNLDMLKQAGAEIVVFSPLHDRELPADLDGLYLGGGYPELHAATLAANRSMREEINKFSESGRPVYGECGGFMYLTDSIIDFRGTEYPMAGVFPVKARMGKRLRRLGYRQVELQDDTLFGPQGTFCYGHEFHYSEIDPMPTWIERAYVLDDGRAEGYRIRNTLAGYVHLHWGRTPEAVRNFINMMKA